MKLVERRVVIEAPPAAVYELLTTADGLAAWMAPSATAEAWPGGVVRWTHENGDTVAGQYLELVPSRRVVFTYGWERAEVGVPPGSTVVEIDLRPHPHGTELHLVHRGLEGPMAEAHDGGWAHYLGRLSVRASGREPGPDTLASERVPTRDELDQS